MAKKITFTNKEGRTYTLEFNRDVVRSMERSGFNLDDLEKMPLNTSETLFCGALVMHHKNMSKNNALEMFYSIKDKEKLLAALIEMYQEPYKTLVSDDDEEDSDDLGNATWEPSW